MTKCNNCKREFPDHLFAPTITSEGSYTVCPICSLKLRNNALGIAKDTPFKGEIANEMYEEALEFLSL